MKYVLFATFICLIIGCSESISDTKVDWNLPILTTNSPIPKNYKLDSLILDTVSISSSGTLSVLKNKIAFIDHEFCWFILFDTTGKFISRKIGQGDGVNQLPCKKISNYVSRPNGDHIFLGPTWDVYIFDSSFKKKSDYLINWHPKGNKEFILQHPDPADPIMYSITYGIQPIRADNNFIFIPIFSQHKLFFPAVKNYADEARIFGKLDINKGDVSQLFGRLSPIYRHNLSTRTFPYPIYDLKDEAEMIISFPVDSLIYISDKSFHIKSAFGRMGRNMDTNYESTNDYNKFNITWRKEFSSKGTFTGIDYISEQNIILRTYHKNGNSKYDGLQIYKNKTLISDIDIPVNIKYVGYIAPYAYFSTGPDDIGSTLKLYKIKL